MIIDVVLFIYVLMKFWTKIMFEREFEFVYCLVFMNLSSFSFVIRSERKSWGDIDRSERLEKVKNKHVNFKQWITYVFKAV